jgi:hypothetical protein
MESIQRVQSFSIMELQAMQAHGLIGLNLRLQQEFAQSHIAAQVTEQVTAIQDAAL